MADAWVMRARVAMARGQAWGRMIQTMPDEIGLCWLMLAGLAAGAGASSQWRFGWYLFGIYRHGWSGEVSVTL